MWAVTARQAETREMQKPSEDPAQQVGGGQHGDQRLPETADARRMAHNPATLASSFRFDVVLGGEFEDPR